MKEGYLERHIKSFMKVGLSFIDVKLAIGVSFYKELFGYVGVLFIFENGKALNVLLKNRDEFSLFLLQLDNFIDDPTAMNSIDKVIKDVEAMPAFDYSNFALNIMTLDSSLVN